MEGRGGLVVPPGIMAIVVVIRPKMTTNTPGEVWVVKVVEQVVVPAAEFSLTATPQIWTVATLPAFWMPTAEMEVLR